MSWCPLCQTLQIWFPRRLAWLVWRLSNRGSTACSSERRGFWSANRDLWCFTRFLIRTYILHSIHRWFVGWGGGLISKDSSIALYANDSKLYRLSGRSRGAWPPPIFWVKKKEKLAGWGTKNRLPLISSRSVSTTEAYQYLGRSDYFSKWQIKY